LRRPSGIANREPTSIRSTRRTASLIRAWPTSVSNSAGGKASALAALGEATRRSGRQLVEIVDVLAGRELGAIVAIERVGTSGETTDIRRVLLYRVLDGQLVECWLYDEDQRLVDRLWSAG
jgi:hypothetical protein